MTIGQPRPTPGRIVMYVSKNGDGIESPAMVLRTRATTNLEIIGAPPGSGPAGQSLEDR